MRQFIHFHQIRSISFSELLAQAESEQMAKKADAYKEYGKAAKIDIWMESLPKMAAEVAAPMSQCERITMVMDLDSKTGGVGPSKVTDEVMSIMTNIPATVAASAGVNLVNIWA